MKALLLLLVLLLATLAHSNDFENFEKGWQGKDSESDDILFLGEDENISEQIVRGLNQIFQRELSRAELGSSPDPALPRITKQILSLKNQILGEESESEDEQPWFRFIPYFQGNLIPSNQTGGGSVPIAHWSTPCFSQVSAEVSLQANGTALLQITSDKPNKLVCEDFYLIATLENLLFKNIDKRGTESFQWGLLRARPAEMFDIQQNGFRVFLFSKGPVETLKYITSTIELFQPEFKGPGVDPVAAEKNVAFLNNYTDFTFDPRGSVQIVDIDPSTVNSGDFFGITRLDGLDPMIDWGMGGTTGHTTVALWIEGELNVCESTVTDVYWPTNGIQCHPWDEWIILTRNASFNLIHVPLSPQYASMFNATAAYEFFKTVEGLPYGYHNFLFGWIDTEHDNFPCLPPDYNQCLTLELVNVGAGLFDRLDKFLANKMYNEALNKRLNTDLKTTAEIFEYAITQEGITFGQLITMPEQDEWVYSDGKSMVCDVFVCSIWKAGGLFGDLKDQFQCTELTPRDVYSMAFFDANYVRPPQCVAADPNSPFCQLSGNYTMYLPGYNTKQPYANMAQNCPGIPPSYVQPSNC